MHIQHNTGIQLRRLLLVLNCELLQKLARFSTRVREPVENEPVLALGLPHLVRDLLPHPRHAEEEGRLDVDEAGLEVMVVVVVVVGGGGGGRWC